MTHVTSTTLINKLRLLKMESFRCVASKKLLAMHTSRYLHQVCVQRAGFSPRAICVTRHKSKCSIICVHSRLPSTSSTRDYRTASLNNSKQHLSFSSRHCAGNKTHSDVVDNLKRAVKNKSNDHHKTVQPHSTVTEWGNTNNISSEVNTKKTMSTSSKDTITLGNIFSDFNKERTLKKLLDGMPEVSRPYKKHEKLANAAVLVPFCYVNGEPSILFMKRSMHLKNHRGEISFPGGMHDEGDRDMTHTALRETYEEIGLSSDKVDIWAELWGSPSTMSGNWVTPAVGFCGEMDTELLNLNTDEVAAVFTTPISALCDPAHQRQTQWRYPGTGGYTLPVFTGGEHRIWGLTAIMLHQVLTLVAPGLYNFKLKHRS